jgi:glutathione S-transferase
LPPPDVQYEDCRYPLAIVDGAYVRKEFDEVKAAGTFKFGQVPTLEVDGVQLAQSKAIERYVARETGLLGSTSIEVRFVLRL